MKVLILDANQRAALAATRSLGHAGYAVIAADTIERTLAGASRHAVGSLRYPSPYHHAQQFIEWADKLFEHAGIEAALPITEVTTDLLLRHRDRWPNIALPFAPIEAIDELSNKVSLYKRASALDVPVPRSAVVQTPDELRQAITEIGLPGVMKPARSRVRVDDHFVSTTVVRVTDIDSAIRYASMPEFSHTPFLYQSMISGEGRGIFALYNHGHAVGFFAHRRLREKPPEGGVSVCSESCSPDPVLVEFSRKLLDGAAWHGIAMVEFKGDYLMEVNARFWGSLQLAIDSGVDFPRLLIDLALRGIQPTITTYRIGQRLRWLLGDVDRLYLIAKRRNARELLREIGRFLRPTLSRTRHETFRWTDPAPTVREVQQYFAAIKQRP